MTDECCIWNYLPVCANSLSGHKQSLNGRNPGGKRGLHIFSFGVRIPTPPLSYLKMFKHVM